MLLLVRVGKMIFLPLFPQLSNTLLSDRKSLGEWTALFGLQNWLKLCFSFSSTKVVQVPGNSALDLILDDETPNNPDCFAASNNN